MFESLIFNFISLLRVRYLINEIRHLCQIITKHFYFFVIPINTNRLNDSAVLELIPLKISVSCKI